MTAVDRSKFATTALRLLLTLLLVAPPAAWSQAPKVARIGFLGLTSPADYAPNLEAFRQELRTLGYDEGRNITIEFRWANGRDERLPALAAELVRLDPDILVTHAAPGIRAAQKATSTIPIVMGVSADPDRLGFIQSLRRPGGNTTGVATLQVDLADKRLELFKETIPTLRRVAVLLNPASPAGPEELRRMQVGAVKLGVTVRPFELPRDAAGLEAMFAAIDKERPDGLIVVSDALAAVHGVRIAEFAVRRRIPSMGGGRGFVQNGGLASYGGDYSDGWRAAARYVDKILKGAKPSQLPVEQPTKFYLGINLKTARSLGLTIPSAILLRADDVVH